MIRRHPTPPLFPYTTLFRSRLRPQLVGGCSGWCASPQAASVEVIQLILHLARGVAVAGLQGYRDAALQDGAGLGDAAQAVQDRKSTRLNSSHVAISYAVFCL